MRSIDRTLLQTAASVELGPAGGDRATHSMPHNRVVVASPASFGMEPKEAALAPGGRVWTDDRGRETPGLELFRRGGSAWEAFGPPPAGVRIRLTTV